MRRPIVLLRRSLIFVHRWLGVALSLLFLLWFVSGIVMMYWTFPAVSTQDRLQRAPVLDPARIVLTPGEAFASAGLDPAQGQVRLTTFDGRPVYRVGSGRGGFAVVYADTGTEQWFVDEALADRSLQCLCSLFRDCRKRWYMARGPRRRYNAHMSMTSRGTVPALLVAVAASAAWLVPGAGAQQVEPPSFMVDPAWPSVPNNWVLGEVTSIAVDSSDHVWVLHRPRSIPEAQRANAAPAVLEFDGSGKLLRSWGGAGEGYEWPEREHGIYVDHQDNVWISGNGGWPKPSPGGSTDDMILKFSPEGKFLLQIGRRGQSTGNADTNNVHQPGDVFVHEPANELYVADGYGNQRVIVFDAGTGRFKRMWGAFGNTPEAPAPAARGRGRGAAPGGGAAAANPGGPPQFGLVHAVKVSNDGIVYVADRSNNRIQTFTTEGKYLKQVQVEASGMTAPVPAGFAFSPDPKQQFLYVVDSGPMRVVIFERATLTQIGSIGMRGSAPGEFDIVHHMAADSKGNLYTAEIVTNRRAQKFVTR